MKFWKNWPYWVRGGAVGFLLGFFVWFYDYDFLLNMGGPETPLSDYIRSLFDVVSYSYGAAFFPLKILAILGVVIGLFVGFIYGKIKNRNKQIIN